MQGMHAMQEMKGTQGIQVIQGNKSRSCEAHKKMKYEKAGKNRPLLIK